MPKSSCWLNIILPTLVMAKLKQVWLCSSNLTSWFYFMTSLEPTLKRGAEVGRFSSDGLSWNNFAERYGRIGKKTSLPQFNSMIFAELSYYSHKLIEKTAVGELDVC